MLEENKSLTSKVLLYEANDEYTERLKSFLHKEELIGLRAHSFEKIKELLKTNTDLGGIFLGGKIDKKLLGLVDEIYSYRPELPIFLREGSPKETEHLSSMANIKYMLYPEEENLTHLRELIDQYIFNMDYPNILVRGVKEISTDILQSMFSNGKIIAHPPYLVKDRFVYGGMFTLMPIISSWCNGYMITEAKEMEVAKSVPVSDFDPKLEFRKVNSVLGELTNLIWGGIKARFVKDELFTPVGTIQVPIMVNHEHKYLSFGTKNPQLCFHYSLYNQDETSIGEIYQKFVFHLNWAPESLQVNAEVEEEMVATGELELF